MDQSFDEGSRWSVDFSETKPLLTTPKVDWEALRRTKVGISKSVVALAVGGAVVAVGLRLTDDLWRSLPADGGGVAVLGVGYVAAILSNLLTNAYAVRKLGSKSALVVSGALLSGASIAAHSYPQWALTMPLAVVAGIGAATLWATFSGHLARVADRYAAVADCNDADGVKALVFGFVGFALHVGTTVAGLMSSVLIKGGVASGNSTATFCDYSGGGECLGGQWDDGASVQKPDATFPSHGLEQFSVYLFLAFCLAVALFGIVIIGALVEPLSSLGIVDQNAELPAGSLLWVTVRLWRNPKQVLLIPMSIIYALPDAVWRIQFSTAYFSCSPNHGYIGLVSVCYHVAALLSSMICGCLGRRKLRFVTVPVLAMAHLGVLVSTLIQRPPPDGSTVALILTAVNGFAAGGLSTLITAFCGIVFADNVVAAYSNLYLWHFLGLMLMLDWSFWTCLQAKLIVALAIMVIGLVGYIATEILLRRQLSRDALSDGGEDSTNRLLVPAGF